MCASVHACLFIINIHSNLNVCAHLCILHTHTHTDTDTHNQYYIRDYQIKQI